MADPMQEWLDADLFDLGQECFDRYKRELLAYGLDVDPRMRLRRSQGLLCWYSLEHRDIFLAIPDWTAPSIAVFQMILGSLFDAADSSALLRFMRLFVPRVIAHELGHHLRHRRKLFDGTNLWREEQIANELALALTKHRWTPAEREFAGEFLRRGMEALSRKVGRATFASDSYSNVLEALYTEGRLGTRTISAIQTVGELFDVEPLEVLRAAGVVPEDVLARLAGRDDLIADFNSTYTSDQLTYMYYQMGWMQVDLTSRETGYVEEFARNYLDPVPRLLPHIEPDARSTTEQVKACHAASLECRGVSPVAERFFYKRYRTELLERLQEANLGVPLQTASLRRHGAFLLETWEEGHADRMEMLGPLVPPHLRELLPSRIAAASPLQGSVAELLPSEPDRRLHAHVVLGAHDPAAQGTLERLQLLDRSDLFRTLPAEVLTDVAHAMFDLRLEAGEVIIWQGDHQNDVYIPVEGALRWEVAGPDGALRNRGPIAIGEVFGEMSFLTETPRNATVLAVVPSRCLVLKSSELSILIHEYPAIIKKLASVMVLRLARANVARVQD